MISVKTNIGVVSANLIKKLQILKDPRPLLRPVAIDVLSLMTERIHIDGKAADGSQIGTYSPGYMKVRTGNFGNSARNVKGANKGKIKNAGTISRGANKGKARPKYNVGGDTKIIVSLTRQLQNNWAVLSTQRGYGIGFNDPFSAKKMRWVEESKKKKIVALTTSEREYAVAKLKKLVEIELNK